MAIEIANYEFDRETAEGHDADFGLAAVIPLPGVGEDAGEVCVAIYPPVGEEPTDDQRAAVEWVAANAAELHRRVEACVFDARTSVYAEPWDDDLVSNPTSPDQIRDEWSIERIDILPDPDRPRFGRLVIQIEGAIDEEHGFAVILEREARLSDRWTTFDGLLEENLTAPDPDMDEAERAEVEETAAYETARGSDHPVAMELAAGTPHYRAHPHLLQGWVLHAIRNADAELLTTLLRNGADGESAMQTIENGRVVETTPRDWAGRIRELLDNPDGASAGEQRLAFDAEMLLHRFGNDAIPMMDSVLEGFDTPSDPAVRAEIEEAANPTVTPEMIEEAVRCGNVPLIQLAELQGVPVPADAAAAGLCRAVGDGNVEMITALLDVGGDPTRTVAATTFTTQAGEAEVSARELADRMKRAVHDGPPQSANPLMAMQRNLGESMQKLLSGELPANPPTAEEMEADPNSSLSMLKRLAEAESSEEAQKMMAGMLSGGNGDPVDSWIEYRHGHYQRNVRDPAALIERITDLLEPNG